MARIRWIEDNEAQGPTADAFASVRSHSMAGNVPDILRTMSQRPEFMLAIDEASRTHFSDGYLTRAQHEMIASWVSALNRCHY
jgi:hypothetical protein